MTKTTEVITKTESTALATQPTGDNVPAFLADQVKTDAGKGVSQASDDNIVPLIYILQSNSPQVNRRGPDYIEGAKDGDLWLRNSGIPPIDGDKGLLFQPCYFYREFVVWAPRKTGRGIQGRFAEMPSDAVEMEIKDDDDPTKTKKAWVLPNGDLVVDTRYHVGFALIEDQQSGALTGQVMPFVIPFKSSGHTASRTWMTLMNSKVIGSDIAPSWACRYRVKTRSRTNNDGTWNAISVEDAGWVQTKEEYDRGARLHTQMASGELKGEVDNGAPGGQAAPTGDNKTGAM